MLPFVIPLPMYICMHYILTMLLICSLCVELIVMVVVLSEIHDIQDATIEPVSGGVHVNVTYFSGSSAVGCFIVVQSDRNCSDHYQVLPRNGTTASDEISLPPADTGYTVLVYDLEDGLPSTVPAIEGILLPQGTGKTALKITT